MTELFILPTTDPKTIISFNPNKDPDNLVYVAGGYTFSKEKPQLCMPTELSISSPKEISLQNGQQFTLGRYTFRYIAPGKGVLAQNIDNEHRFYP